MVAHPLLGGLEAVGPPVGACTSVDEIIDAVRKFADDHPDDEWIIGASYDGSLAPGGLFDARWLDAAVPDRPVVLRAWDYHTAWCNSVALDRAGITADTPDPVLGEIPRREDGSVLGRCANGRGRPDDGRHAATRWGRSGGGAGDGGGLLPGAGGDLGAGRLGGAGRRRHLRRGRPPRRCAVGSTSASTPTPGTSTRRLAISPRRGAALTRWLRHS